MKDQGFSDRVVDRIQKSPALSTKAHYKSQWDVFVALATDTDFQTSWNILSMYARLVCALSRIITLQFCFIGSRNSRRRSSVV